MESFWINWILLIGIFGMAVLSPGPDFIVAVRNSISYSRKIGIITAMGFALGVCVHVTYTLFGIAALIAQSIILFNILKYAGAAYLFYMGVRALLSKGFKDNKKNVQRSSKTVKNAFMSPLQALWSGFLTNILNPKATLFFLAVFSQFVGPATSMTVQITYAGTCVALTGIWFSLVAIILTNPKIKTIFMRWTKWIDRICGTLLIALGIKLVLTKAV